MQFVTNNSFFSIKNVKMDCVCVWGETYILKEIEGKYQPIWYIYFIWNLIQMNQIVNKVAQKL